jgi:NMD protein affecting ribosome stability and mRNA decay
MEGHPFSFKEMEQNKLRKMEATPKMYCSHCQRFKTHFANKPDGTFYKTCEGCRTKLAKKTSWLKQKYICDCAKKITHHSKSQHTKACPLRTTTTVTNGPPP